MKTILTLLLISYSTLLIAQNLEVEGKAKIIVMDNTISSDSVVVRLPDGTLGLQPVSALPFISTQTPYGQYYFLDKDSDGFGDKTQPVWVPNNVGPPEMFIINSEDCNDVDSTINPDAMEICDSLDNDCNSLVDDNTGPEICDDGKDNDCDGQIDEECELADGSPCSNNDECNSNICFAGICGCDISGTWTLNTSIQYSCATGFIDIDFSTVEITSDCDTITISANGNQLLQGSFNDNSFETSFVLMGLCNETYSMNGTFNDQANFTATYSIDFSGNCSDCTFQTFNISGTK